MTGDFAKGDAPAAIAQAINQTMLMAGAGRAISVDKRLSPRSPSPRAARFVASRKKTDVRRIDLAAAPDASWTLSFVDGVPQFTPHSAAVAAAKMEQRRATLRNAADFLGIDWSDLWNSFTGKVMEIVEVVVQAVVDEVNKVVTEIKAQITLLIDNIEYYFDSAISLVEQAFDMAAGFFRKVGAEFEKLFDWLGYVFNFDDIKRTADVFSHIFSTTLGVSVAAVGAAKEKFDTSFDALETQLDAQVERFIASFAPAESVKQTLDPLRPPMPALELRANNNFLLDALTTNLSSASTAPIDARLIAKDGPLDALGKKLQAIADDLATGRGKEAFNSAADYFARIVDDPSHGLELAFAGLLRALEGVVLFTVEVAKILVDLLFDAVSAILEALQTLLDTPWSLPFVSEIYKAITGQELLFKPLDLLALIVAIPATPIYKILDGSGEAPFPNASAVARFKSWFTVERFEAYFQPGARPRMVSMQPGDFIDVGRKFMHVAYATNFLCRAVLETKINTDPKPDRFYVLLNIFQRLASSAVTIPWALSDDPGGFDGPDQLKDLSNIIWVSQLVCGPLRGLAAWITQETEVGHVTASMWGGFHLALHVTLLAEENAQDPLEIIETVLTCLAPQLLKILQTEKIQEATRGASLGVLGATTLLSEVAIAEIHLTRVFGPHELQRLAAVK